jgi:hypothetical protein
MLGRYFWVTSSVLQLVGFLKTSVKWWGHMTLVPPLTRHRQAVSVSSRPAWSAEWVTRQPSTEKPCFLQGGGNWGGGQYHLAFCLKLSIELRITLNSWPPPISNFYVLATEMYHHTWPLPFIIGEKQQQQQQNASRPPPWISFCLALSLVFPLLFPNWTLLCYWNNLELLGYSLWSSNWR